MTGDGSQDENNRKDNSNMLQTYLMLSASQDFLKMSERNFYGLQERRVKPTTGWTKRHDPNRLTSDESGDDQLAMCARENMCGSRATFLNIYSSVAVEFVLMSTGAHDGPCVASERGEETFEQQKGKGR